MTETKFTHTIHGIKFVRTGFCNQCGECGCNRCPHGVKKDGQWTCLIYETRAEVCKPCSEAKGKDITHQVCVDFPDHPFLWVLKDGMCAYKFEPAKQEDADKLSILKEGWGK